MRKYNPILTSNLLSSVLILTFHIKVYFVVHISHVLRIIPVLCTLHILHDPIYCELTRMLVSFPTWPVCILNFAVFQLKMFSPP